MTDDLNELISVNGIALRGLKWWPAHAAFQLASDKDKPLKLARQAADVPKSQWRDIDAEIKRHYDMKPCAETVFWRYYS